MLTPQQHGLFTEVNYSPGPTALKAHLSSARVKLAWGPVRSGKSVWLVWRFFFKAMEQALHGAPPMKGLLIRDTFRNLEDTTLKTFRQWVGPFGEFRQRQGVTDFTFNATVDGLPLRGEVLFRHGQTASDASSFLSSEYGVIGMDEIAPAYSTSGTVSPGISEEVFDLALTRLCQPDVLNREMALCCNPPTPQHWGFRRIIGLPPDELKAAGFAQFFFPGEENAQNLPPGYYDELKRLMANKPHMLRRFVLGEIVSIHPGMPVFSAEFRQKLHVVDNLKPWPKRPLILGWDFGLTPACVVTQLTPKGQWLVLAELQGGYVNDTLSEQIGIERFGQMVIDMLAERFPENPVEKHYADPNALNQKAQTDEKTCKQILQKIGFKNITGGAVDLTSRLEAVRTRLTTLIDGEPGILISRQGCPLLIEALSGGYRYGVSRDATRIHGAEPVKDEYSHIVDALEYPASKLFKPTQIEIASRHTRRLPPSGWAA